MIKTHYRDYATEAFRILALEGSSEKFRERIWNEALDDMERRKERSGSISAPTEAAIMRAQKALDDAKATILDLEAAEFALEALEKMRGRAAVKAVRAVYMIMPDQPIKRGEIQQRVEVTSVELPADPRTIYHWLSLARSLFAEHRGLRM
ncbi:MAG: hypothetical protein ACI4NL_00630 [Christensenellales bacterium]